ncbi:nuclear transport factor 2 family protein [Nocardia callitridis]|uniref:Nuclear transport factor 2 family protein n=1 Tax=Nocardia callitridis TaxID=648753 RepID=A0ABP9L5J8_9NOCA
MAPESSATPDQRLLAAVEASPRAVAVHDRAAWVGLFTADATVNDPVGSAPHTGHQAIGRFYDTFIGPNTIEFQVDRDMIHSAVNTVVRDLTLRTTMSTGATIIVPMHLRYQLVEREGEWKIAQLAAHWELAGMIVQLLRTGLPGLAASAKLGPQLIANLGVGGAAGMLRGLFGVGRAGKRATDRLFHAATEAETDRVRDLLHTDAVLEIPVGTKVSVEEFTAKAAHLRWDKVIAAGRSVSTSIRLGPTGGVALLEFDKGTTKVTALRVFLDSES